MTRERARHAIGQQRTPQRRRRSSWWRSLRAWPGSRQKSLRLLVVRQKRQITAPPPLDQERRSLIAIRMTADVGASIQFQSHAVADLLPDTGRRHRVLEKKASDRYLPPAGNSGCARSGTVAGSARNQRTTSGTEAMFLSVTVQLCASSSGAPMRSRISRARSVNASRTRVKIAFALDPSRSENHGDRPASCRCGPRPGGGRPPITKSFEKFGVLEQCLSVRHEHGHEADAHGIAARFRSAHSARLARQYASATSPPVICNPPPGPWNRRLASICSFIWASEGIGTLLAFSGR